MLRRAFTSFTLLVLFTAAGCAAATAPAKPKLVVGIVIDQFRYDYLTRFRADYHGGFDQLLTRGADFTNAFYRQTPTVTAVGHSIFMSGAMPAVSGIVGNSWYDRSAGQVVTSVCDWDTRTIGGHQDTKAAACTDSDPASPKRLLVTTIGDELKDAQPASKVIGISIKSRAAILPSGHRANGAFWLDDVTGNFITSSYYMDALPAWAIKFNDRKLPAAYINRKWEGFPKWDFHAPPGSSEPYAKLPASPWGNELIEQFAEQAITGEHLGHRNATDLLTISFSSNDYIGHAVGPDAPEVRDISIRTDQLLAKLFRYIDREVGLENVLFVLSADHGVAPVPDPAHRLPGGYVQGNLASVIESALNAKFGRADWLIPGTGKGEIYFNWPAIEKVTTPNGQAVEKSAVYRVAKSAILVAAQLHVARVYTREQLDNGIAGDFIAVAAMNGYFPTRSPDLTLILEPGFIPGTKGTTHFSPYSYDRHVPIIFMGSGIKPGRYDETVAPNDIAPTLATFLDIQTPSGSSGRVLTEMLAR